jgi:chromosome condensin MukBEF ATPase and DNA-binding subunit MukB
MIKMKIEYLKYVKQQLEEDIKKYNTKSEIAYLSKDKKDLKKISDSATDALKILNTVEDERSGRTAVEQLRNKRDISKNENREMYVKVLLELRSILPEQWSF